MILVIDGGYSLENKQSFMHNTSVRMLSEEQQQIKINLINLLKNYKNNLSDINNYEILLQYNSISDNEKDDIKNKIKCLRLRLMYLDNLIAPLRKSDKKIIYYKFIEGLTYPQILLKLNKYENVHSIHVRAFKLLDILTLRTNPLIFEGNFNDKI